jgi:methionyl-tRNA formyltransferase
LEPSIVLLAATRRGLRVAHWLHKLVPDARLTIFSFSEEAHEPPFVEAIEEFARLAGATFFQARRVERVTEFWSSTSPDLMLAVHWRYLLPRDICERPRRGTYVFHDSLLPEYRGFSPTVWAVANGSDRAGVTLLAAADEVDTGDIVDQQSVPVGPDDTIDLVFDRVTHAYLAVLERSLSALLNGTAQLTPQDHARATYCCRRTDADNRVDWSLPTRRVWDLIRASGRPYQGAWTMLDGRQLRIWEARIPSVQRRFVSYAPGRVAGQTSDGVLVLTGDGEICIRTVGLDGQTLDARQLLKSFSMTLA